MLLVKLMDQWKGQHDGQIPASFNDKNAFKATIKAASRNYFGESNFQEAFNNAYLSYADDIPDTYQTPKPAETVPPVLSFGSQLRL